MQPKCVPPAGPANARVAYVGEGPDEQEVKRGVPFIGASGIKLEEILWEAHRLTRSQVFLTNSAICRPETPGLEGKDRFKMDNYMKWVKQENGRRAKANKVHKKLGEPLEPLLMDPHTACRPRLLRELAWLDAQARKAGAPNGIVVQPLGNYALKSLRAVSGIMKYRGSVMLPKPDDFKELG